MSICAGLATAGVSPLQASVEDGRKRIDLQFASLGDEEVGGVAVSDDGLVIIAGSTDDDFAGESAFSEDDGLLFATDDRGRIQWATLEPGLSEVPGDEFEFFNDAIVHSNGDIYVVGQIDGDGITDGQAVISRYSTDGELVDRMVWGDDPDTGWDEAQSLVEGPDGKIYVVGYTTAGFDEYEVDGYAAAFVIVLDPELSDVSNPTATYWFDRVGDDRAYSITFDDSTFYIAGRVDDNDDGSYDWYVAKYDPSAVDGWVTRLGGDDADIWEDGNDRAWDVTYSSETEAIYVGGYLGGTPVYGDDTDPPALGQRAFVMTLNPSDLSGDLEDLVLCNCNDSEIRSVPIDRLGHVVLPISFDGDDPASREVVGDPLQGGRDSLVQHGISESESVWWEAFSTSGDDEIVNSVVDRRGNLWLVGTTSGDFADSNGGEDDIFLSLYRNSDRRHPRPAKPTVTWSASFGADRFASALTASRNESTGGAVILVNGRNQTDILAASLLDASRSSTEIGRVLYLDSGAEQVLESVRTELQRIGPTSVSIVGDETSISADVMTTISTVVSVAPSRATPAEIVDRIIESALPSSSLVLIGNDTPTSALQAISWSNAIVGTALPFDVAVFELERLRSVGFDSLVVVGSLDPARQAAIPLVESTLGKVAHLVQDPTPGELSATMASQIGPRPDIAVVSPNNWLDAVHANSVRRPIVWAGPDCVQAAAVAALDALSPTRSIMGFGGAVAVLGDPRLALRC